MNYNYSPRNDGVGQGEFIPQSDWEILHDSASTNWTAHGEIRVDPNLHFRKLYFALYTQSGNGSAIGELSAIYQGQKVFSMGVRPYTGAAPNTTNATGPALLLPPYSTANLTGTDFLTFGRHDVAAGLISIPPIRLVARCDTIAIDFPLSGQISAGAVGHGRILACLSSNIKG